MHGLPSMPPFPNPLQPLADAWKGVTRWWRRAVRPAFWGCFGGFLVAMVAAALAELAHAALGGSSSPQWLGAVTVLFFIAGGASIFFLVKRAAEPSGAVGAGVADALTDRASGVIVAHNHPEGSLEPSETDVEVTAQLKAAGSVIGISLLDHIIFNRGEYFSFLESGRL